jgi:hypothetical protein
MLRISVAAILALVTLSQASASPRSKQLAEELKQLDSLRDECVAAISDAQRNDNVWQSDKVSMQDCRDMAMKQINLGQKMIEESVGDDE